jgi:hypothetical protein
MIGKAQALLSISLPVLLIAASCSIQPLQYNEDGVSDEEYIRIASAAEEAQAFLNIYPDSEIYVDRSSKLAVDFRFNKHIPASTNQSWEGIRMRVVIDPKDKQVAGVFVDCKDNSRKQQFIEDDLIHYLEQYSKNNNCP